MNYYARREAYMRQNTGGTFNLLWYRCTPGARLPKLTAKQRRRLTKKGNKLRTLGI